MAEGQGIDRLFATIARMGTEHPWRVLLVALAILVAASTVIPGLAVSTSRTGLVSDEDPQQQRMNAYYQRFGRPDSPLFLVSGGDAEQRHRVVDALMSAISSRERFEGRVLGRIDPHDVAGVLLLQQPDALAQLRSRLPEGVEVPALIESGVVGWMGALQQQLEAGLEGEAGAEVDPRQAASSLGELALLADALDVHLFGGRGLAQLRTRQDFDQEGVDSDGYLVTTDGEHHLVIVYPEIESDEGRDLEPLVEELRAIRDEVLARAPEGITADLTGLPAISVDELQVVEEGLSRSSVATTAGIFGLCLILFRSMRQTVVALLPLLPGVVLSLAAVALLYDDLNLITSSFVAVLLGLGIDFSVHFIARRNEEVRDGRSEVEALQTALRRTGPGIMTGALVTAAAFLTTASTDFTAYGELGIITAIGLVVIMLATFFLLPPLMVIGRGERKTRAAPEPPGLRAAAAGIRRYRFVLVVFAVSAAIAGAFSLRTIEFDSRYFGFLPERTESARALVQLEYDPVASPVFAALTAESIEEARAKTEQLRKMSTVAGVQSPTDLLPELTEHQLDVLARSFEAFGRDPNFEALAAQKLTAPQLRPVVLDLADTLDEVRYALESAGLPTEGAEKAARAYHRLHERLGQLDEAGTERLAALHADLVEILEPAWTTARDVAQRGGYVPSDLPELFARRFASKDRQAVAIFAVPAGEFWEVEVADAFAADVRSVDPDAAGLAMIHVEHGQMILAGFKRAALLAAGIIVVLLVVDFRRFGDAMLALLPTALGWLWMLGAMALIGLEFDVANIVALPLVLGIGIAFGVHMMHRLREEAQDHVASIEEVVRGTGGAIVVAALTTMVGFAGLTVADYGGMKSLGAVMVLGIASCLAATVFILPAVLVLLKRAR